jgi:hypothetical protein
MAVHVAQSAVLPLPLAAAYERTVVTPLPELFDARHLSLPAVAEVTDQTGGPWGSTGPGQSRTTYLADGGRLTETLTEVDAPHGFGYHLEPTRGPLRPVVSHVDGRWTFTALTPDATTVTWSWTLHPRSLLTAVPARAVAAMWPGYARRTLLRLELLVTRA